MNKSLYIVVCNHDTGQSSIFDHVSDIALGSAKDYENLEKEVRELFSRRKDAAGWRHCTLNIIPNPVFRSTAYLPMGTRLNLVFQEEASKVA